MQLIFLCPSKMPKESHAQINFIIGSQKVITSANINSKQDNLQVIKGKESATGIALPPIGQAIGGRRCQKIGSRNIMKYLDYNQVEYRIYK